MADHHRPPGLRSGDERVQSVTDADIVEARARVGQWSRGLVVRMLSLTGLCLLIGSIVAALVLDEEVGWGSVAVTVAAGLTLALPLAAAFRALVLQKRGSLMTLESVVQERLMHEAAARRDFETRLGRSLEIADDEEAAHETIRRALGIVVPAHPVELLLADNSHARLERVVESDPDGGDGPGCPVSSPNRCIAVRRAQTQRFGDSEALDACPMLRGRPQGRCSAVCVPVSIAGHSVGVLHTTASVEDPLDDDAVEELRILSDQTGHRFGMLRIMAETQLQATTDGLTGLMNRRSLENRARGLWASSTPHAVVMADLDHFKLLNDTYGHEAGDRALRVFAQTVRAHLRSSDLGCRYGGEEFLLVFPDADTFEAMAIVERIRDALRAAADRGGAPAVSSSFGIAHSDDADDFDEVVQRADQALFNAKRAGRDRICLDGQEPQVAPDLSTTDLTSTDLTSTDLTSTG